MSARRRAMNGFRRPYGTRLGFWGCVPASELAGYFQASSGHSAFVKNRLEGYWDAACLRRCPRSFESSLAITDAGPGRDRPIIARRFNAGPHAQTRRVPEGRLKRDHKTRHHLSPNISWIVFHIVLLQKRDELLLETALAMMLGLGTNVGDRIGLLRDTIVNAPYPSCHANFLAWFSFIQCDDTPLINCIALASVIFAGNDKRTCR